MILLILHTSLIKSFIRKSIPRAYDLNALSESAELCWMTGTMLLGGIRVFIFRICWKHLNCYQFIFWKLQYWRDWSDIYYISLKFWKHEIFQTCSNILKMLNSFTTQMLVFLFRNILKPSILPSKIMFSGDGREGSASQQANYTKHITQADT